MHYSSLLLKYREAPRKEASMDFGLSRRRAALRQRGGLTRARVAKRTRLAGRDQLQTIAKRRALN
jgi:hypothetical protein